MSQLMSQLWESRQVGEEWGGGGVPWVSGGLLIITGILTSWHQGNVIPHCLCNPENLRSKETQSISQNSTLRLHFTCRRDALYFNSLSVMYFLFITL